MVGSWVGRGRIGLKTDLEIIGLGIRGILGQGKKELGSWCKDREHEKTWLDSSTNTTSCQTLFTSTKLHSHPSHPLSRWSAIVNGTWKAGKGKEDTTSIKIQTSHLLLVLCACEICFRDIVRALVVIYVLWCSLSMLLTSI